MTDSVKPPASKKSPLDILEDVLEDAKGASKVKKNKAQADKEKKQREKLALLRKQKTVEEEKLIQAQLAKMKEVSQMPADQARKAQDKIEKAKSKSQKSSREGYKIQQLRHTKV